MNNHRYCSNLCHFPLFRVSVLRPNNFFGYERCRIQYRSSESKCVTHQLNERRWLVFFTTQKSNELWIEFVVSHTVRFPIDREFYNLKFELVSDMIAVSQILTYGIYDILMCVRKDLKNPIDNIFPSNTERCSFSRATIWYKILGGMLCL